MTQAPRRKQIETEDVIRILESNPEFQIDRHFDRSHRYKVSHAEVFVPTLASEQCGTIREGKVHIEYRYAGQAFAAEYLRNYLTDNGITPEETMSQNARARIIDQVTFLNNLLARFPQ